MQNTNVLVINDYPFLNWRQYADLEKPQIFLAIIPDKGDFGYRRKCQEDAEIIKAIDTFGSMQTYIRPHPQEFTSGTAKRYYEGLVDQYGWLQFDDSNNIDELLTKVSLVIASAETSVVEQAALCKVPVIVYRSHESNINDYCAAIAGGLVCVCHSPEELVESIRRFQDMRPVTLSQHWSDYVNKLGYNIHETVKIDNVLDRLYDSA